MRTDKGEIKMLSYKNILIAVDGSNEAEWAFNKAVDVAKRNDAKLTIVHVIDTRTYTAYEVYASQFDPSKEYSEKLLEGYKELAVTEGVTNVETRLELGPPKLLIPKNLANELNVDLIMCGVSGLNAVERFMIGSVSEAIVRHAPCDVLVVRTEEIPEDFESKVATPEFRRRYFESSDHK